MKFNSGLAVTLVLIFPILFTFVVYPNTFSLSWNEGRGGFLFAMAFIAADLIALNQRIKIKKFMMAIGLIVPTLAYFIALNLGLRDLIVAAAPHYHVQLIYSWTWMWDFIVMALYVGFSLTLLFGKRWYKVAPAGPIYLIGSAIILSFDAFFPYDSLGPLQLIVPLYLQIDQAVIGFIDNYIMNIGPSDPATAHGNLLALNGLHGPFALKVYWPSAGVHSMIIYTLVMLAFLLKMEIPVKRKLVYFGIGAIGTAAINVIRIISLSFFALVITTNTDDWEAFHSVAGEILFLPWLAIYLATVIYLESKNARRSLSITSEGTIIKPPRTTSRSSNENNTDGNNNKLYQQGTFDDKKEKI
jgi:thaumarchaeosortase